MAMLNKGKYGYAVLEVNKLESRTTGNMVANCPLATDFTCTGKDGEGQKYAENGMILFHDPTSKKGNRYGAIIGDGAAENDAATYGLVWATEHIYDDFNKQLSNFRLDRPMDPEKEATPYSVPYGQQLHYQFYPRLYVLGPTDTFTTDAIDMGEFVKTVEGEEYPDLDAVAAAMEEGQVFVNLPTNGGYSILSATREADTYGVVEQITTLPNDLDPAIKIRVLG